MAPSQHDWKIVYRDVKQESKQKQQKISVLNKGKTYVLVLRFFWGVYIYNEIEDSEWLCMPGDQNEPHTSPLDRGFNELAKFPFIYFQHCLRMRPTTTLLTTTPGVPKPLIVPRLESMTTHMAHHMEGPTVLMTWRTASGMRDKRESKIVFSWNEPQQEKKICFLPIWK